MPNGIDIDIIHTVAGELHPSGWLIRVAGEVAVIAPIQDALRVALRMARAVSRTTGVLVGITLTDEDGTVELGRYGEPPPGARRMSEAS